MSTLKQADPPSPEPTDVMTRLADAALEAARVHPEAQPDDDVVVLTRRPVSTGPEGAEYIGGIGTNITAPEDLLDFLLVALRGFAASNGIPLQVIAAGRDC